MANYTPSRSDTEIFARMKLIFFSNEFPRDDLQTLFRSLHRLSKSRDHPILAQFLEEATLALREEIRLLPSASRALIPPFETILNFADFTDLRKGPLCGSMEGILLGVLEIGTIIGLVSRVIKFRLNLTLPDTSRTRLTHSISGLPAHPSLALALGC